jgi:regulator of protease activity HflC (stomatin/prohibitin superfamily)
MKAYSGSGIAIVLDFIIAIAFGAAAGLLFYSAVAGTIVAVIMLLIFLALSIRVISEWNRMPVLRLGRYGGIAGPGLVTIMPIVESTPYSVDTRVISSTISAEQTLTKDNVPVDVEAILFWQVHDAENAVLNVQSYYDSVGLAAQTALRDIIGKSALSEMLAGRNIIGKDIQDLIQDRIREWGINAISVEVRDVKIPKDLQDAMARVATSEREKMARVTLAESESLAADKMVDAAQKYQSNIYAMQLRALNMMYEISLNGKNLMVFIPTDSKGFSIPTPIGIAGIEEMYKGMQKNTKQAKQEQGQK